MLIYIVDDTTLHSELADGIGMKLGGDSVGSGGSNKDTHEQRIVGRPVRTKVRPARLNDCVLD